MTLKLKKTVDQFCRFIEGQPETALLIEQGWGPNGMLAHLVFHHGSYVNEIKTTNPAKKIISHIKNPRRQH